MLGQTTGNKLLGKSSVVILLLTTNPFYINCSKSFLAQQKSTPGAVFIWKNDIEPVISLTILALIVLYSV